MTIARYDMIYTLKPSTPALIWLAAAVGFGPIVGILTWIKNDQPLYGTILFFGGLFIWLSVATIRVNVCSSYIERRSFLRSKWRLPISQISISKGRGGDIAVIPAFIILDKHSGIKAGEILLAPFGAKDIECFTLALSQAGVAFVER